MKQSLTARRMQKSHKRQQQHPKLNLVSLMDIFTILVFFLLINSSDVEVLQNDKTIKLPESTAEQKPNTTLVVRVNSEALLVGNQTVAQVADILASDAAGIALLTKELEYQASRSEPLTEEEKQVGRAVTILGDQEIPYALLKKIMQTCAAAEYRNISLAVSKVASDEEPVVERGVES